MIKAWSREGEDSGIRVQVGAFMRPTPTRPAPALILLSATAVGSSLRASLNCNLYPDPNPNLKLFLKNLDGDFTRSFILLQSGNFALFLFGEIGSGLQLRLRLRLRLRMPF